MKIAGIIEARNEEGHADTSAFVLLANKPALYHVVERMKECQLLDEVVLDAGGDQGNRPVIELAHELDVLVRRTTEPHFLKRLVDIATVCGAGAVVVTEGRSPVLDPRLIDSTICHFLFSGADFATTGSGSGSVKVEVISRSALEHVIAHGEKWKATDSLDDAVGRCNDLRVSTLPADQVPARPDTFLSIDQDDQLAVLRTVFKRLYHAGAPIDMEELTLAIDKIYQEDDGPDEPA